MHDLVLTGTTRGRPDRDRPHHRGGRGRHEDRQLHPLVRRPRGAAVRAADRGHAHLRQPRTRSLRATSATAGRSTCGRAPTATTASPGEGWQIQKGFVPCQQAAETKSHLTTIRLSDREVYRFRLSVTRPAHHRRRLLRAGRLRASSTGRCRGRRCRSSAAPRCSGSNGTDNVVDPDDASRPTSRGGCG